MHVLAKSLATPGRADPVELVLQLYAVHTVPDTSNVFRAIDGVRARKIHLDTPDRREIYVEQTSTVGALWFRKTFTTALNVTELPKEVAMTFDLAQPGLMSKFQVRLGVVLAWWLAYSNRANSSVHECDNQTARVCLMAPCTQCAIVSP